MTYGLYFFSRYWRAKSSKVKECCLFILSPLQVRRWSRRTLTSASSACGRPASTPSSLTTMTFCDASGFSSVVERAFIDKAALSGVFFFCQEPFWWQWWHFLPWPGPARSPWQSQLGAACYSYPPVLCALRRIRRRKRKRQEKEKWRGDWKRDS